MHHLRVNYYLQTNIIILLLIRLCNLALKLKLTNQKVTIEFNEASRALGVKTILTWRDCLESVKI